MKNKFIAYEEVRLSGITNMFDVRQVIRLASDMYHVTLTKEDCFDIMTNYSKYKDKWLGGEK